MPFKPVHMVDTRRTQPPYIRKRLRREESLNTIDRLSNKPTRHFDVAEKSTVEDLCSLSVSSCSLKETKENPFTESGDEEENTDLVSKLRSQYLNEKLK